MSEIYNLKKLVWNENDFEQMTWHDNKVYAIAFNDQSFELALDIDYIVKWVNPEKETHLKFWVAPATLIFRNVYDISLSSDSVCVEILEIVRENPVKPRNSDHINEQFEYNWIIETTVGEIAFKSVGYDQYLKKYPSLLKTQKMKLSERGGISFETKLISQ